MLLDLTEVLSQDGKILEKTVLLEMDAFQIRTGRFPLIRKSPLKLEIVNTGNRVLEIAGYVKLTAVIPCARCLRASAASSTSSRRAWAARGARRARR